jgi:hypothetical protein
MSAITSAGSGNWSATATWTGGAVPGEGDTATIASGHTVTVDQNIVIGADSGTALTITGTLDVPYNIASDYTLTLKGNISIGSSGEFKIGDSSNRLAAARTFDIKINYSDSLAAKEFSFTVPNTGKVSWFGASKTMSTTLAGNVTADTDPTISVADATGWRAGDIIILVDETDRTKTEELLIAAGYSSGTSVALTGTLSNNKTSGHFVMNMTQNIQVKNYSDSYISYFSLAATGSNQNTLSYVMFNNLGDGIQNGVQIGSTTLSTTNLAFISCYKCYRCTVSTNNNIDTLNSYNDDNTSLYISSGTNNTITTLNSVSSTTGFGGTSYAFTKVTNANIYSTSGNAIELNGGVGIEIDTLKISGVNGAGIGTGISNLSGTNCGINTATIKYCSTYGVNFKAAYPLRIKSLTASNNTTADILAGGQVIETSNLSSTTQVSYATNNSGSATFTNYNGTVGDNRFYMAGNLLQNDSTVYRTAAPSLKCYCNNAVKVAMPISAFARTFYVTSGKAITIDLYSYKDSTSTGAEAKLRIMKGTDGHGLSETTEYDILPASDTTWTSKSLSLGTTTSAGFITLELLVVKGSTAWYIYIDDITKTEA